MEILELGAFQFQTQYFQPIFKSVGSGNKAATASLRLCCRLKFMPKLSGNKPATETTFLKSKIIDDASWCRFQSKISRGIEAAINRQQVAALLPLPCLCWRDA